MTIQSNLISNRRKTLTTPFLWRDKTSNYWIRNREGDDVCVAIGPIASHAKSDLYVGKVCPPQVSLSVAEEMVTSDTITLDNV